MLKRTSGNCSCKVSGIFTRKGFLLLIPFITLASSCAKKISETGKASYYADKFQGRKTANGETFRQGKRTAAHRSLPFGTKVRVTNLSNNKTVKVRINDRGPFAAGRIIDLSKKAARKVRMIDAGVSEVRLTYKIKK